MAVLLEIIFRVLLQFAGEHDVSVETVHRSEEIGHWTERDFCLCCKNCRGSEEQIDWMRDAAVRMMQLMLET